MTPPRKPTPHPGVPAGEFDDNPDTGAIEDPLLRIETRQRRTSSETTQAFGAVKRVENQLRDYATRDQKDHELIHGALGDVRTDVRALNTHVGDLREDMGKVSTNVETIVRTMQTKQEVTHAHEVAAIKVESHQKIADIDDTKDRKKFHRSLVLKVVAIAGTIFATLATLVTLAVEHC